MIRAKFLDQSARSESDLTTSHPKRIRYSGKIK